MIKSNKIDYLGEWLQMKLNLSTERKLFKKKKQKREVLRCMEHNINRSDEQEKISPLFMFSWNCRYLLLYEFKAVKI